MAQLRPPGAGYPFSEPQRGDPTRSPDSERVISVATFERQSRPEPAGFWARYRWMIVTAVVIAIAVAVVLLIAYSGGGGGGGGGGAGGGY